MDERLIWIAGGAALILVGAATTQGSVVRKIGFGPLSIDLASRSGGKPTKWLAAIGVALVVIGMVAIVAAFFPAVRMASTPVGVAGSLTSGHDPMVPATGATATEPVPAGSVRIVSPPDGQQVVGHEGVWLAGTASDLGGKYLRILDHAGRNQVIMAT